jgi:hypothetical protein
MKAARLDKKDTLIVENRKQCKWGRINKKLRFIL